MLSDKKKFVSVIMPVYNEEKYIGRCIESLAKQTYPKENMEWIIVDGGSKDATLDILKKYTDEYPIRILNNEKKLVTYALNKGIENAKGDYIVRVDAHAEYCNDYIEKCIDYLETLDIENVGGVAITKGEGYIGQLNSEILSSRFGVGNSNFRTSEKSGYVDTVPFGAFRKEIFDKIGMFDPDLPRSEDNDFNSRIRNNDGKVYLATDISFIYYCRNTVKGLLAQGIKNGNALFLTFKKNPKAMSIRHYVPFLFVLSLIFLPIFSMFLDIFKWIFIGELCTYGLLDLFFCFFMESKKFAFVKFFMYPLFHITYGIGSVLGMLKIKLY